jgi:flagellar FliL protein
VAAPSEVTDETAPADAAAAAPAGGGGIKAWLPAIAAIVLAPALTFAVAQFILLPRFQKALAEPAAAAKAAGAAAAAATEAGKSEAGKPGASGTTYEFTNVVVNLAGTMGTRYLKTSFTISGSDPTLRQGIDGNKPRITDVTLGVLSSLTLGELEEPGARNILRDKLVAAYNQALGRTAVEQVYFSDFLIQ